MASSKIKKSLIASGLALGLVIGGSALAQGSSQLNSSWGGYVVCIDKVSGDMKLRWKSSCPAGYTTKVFGARGQLGLTGAAGAQGEQGVQGLQGEQGVQGLQGEQGAVGLAGETGAAGQDATAESLVLTPEDFANGWSGTVETKNILGYNHKVLVLPPNENFKMAAPFVAHSSWANATSFTLELMYVTSTSDASTWTLEHGINGYSVGEEVRPNATNEATITPAGSSGLQKAVTRTGVYKGSIANSDFLEVLIGRWGTAENLNPSDIWVLSVKVTPNF